MEKQSQESQFPPENFHGDFKIHTSKLGFKVIWFNMSHAIYDSVEPDLRKTYEKPGIYIRFTRPDGKLTEQIFFAFGDEEKAEQKYQELVKKVDDWDKSLK